MNIPVSFIPDEEKGYTALCLLYPVISEGDTLEEAEKNIQEAIECHLEGLEKEKYTNPELYEYELSFQRNLKNATQKNLFFA